MTNSKLCSHGRGRDSSHYGAEKMIEKLAIQLEVGEVLTPLGTK